MNLAPSLRRRIPAIPESTGWGVLLAAVAAGVSGLAIWLNAYAVKQVPDAGVYTTLKNAVAAGLLLAGAAAIVRPADVRAVTRSRWIALTAVGIVGGGVAFLLFFSGLAAATAPSAAFIQKTLFVWVAIVAVPFLGERLGPVQIVALAALLAGQAFVLPPRAMGWGPGETMILAATLLWAAEVVVVRRYLRGVPTAIVAVGRLGIGLVALVGWVVVAGRAGAIAALTPAAWAWLLLSGTVLAVYVATWFAALHRAPATVVTSVLVAGAVITGILQSLVRGGPPTPEVAGGYVLIAAATFVVGVAAVRAARAGRTVAQRRPVAVRVRTDG